MRIRVIRVITVVLFLMIVMDLFYMQAIQGRHFFNLSANNRIRVVPLDGWRGRIYDRNGKILADNRLSYDVMVTPQDVQKGEELFQFLSGVLDVEQHLIAQRYNQKKIAPFAPVAVAEDISQEKAILIEENKYRFPSLFVYEGFNRSYPLGKSGAHVLGYIGKINRARKDRFKEYGYSLESVVGYSGVEEYYDTYLRGEEGGIQIEVNSRGQQVRLIGLREPKQGQDITLTVDTEIQQDAAELLEDRRGAIVVMDMDNGDILALTSSPSFDPNVFMQSRSRGQVGSLFTDASAPVLNRAIQGVFPPGSVFKTIVATAALNTGKITPHTSFVCAGAYFLKKARFRCTHVHGSQNLIEAVAHSCNVYFFNTGLLLGAETIGHYARLLGLGEMTHIDLPYEEDGSISWRRQRQAVEGDQWRAGDTLNISIGQGAILVTPLQLVCMMATIAKDGVPVRPHVIKSIAGMDVDKPPPDPVPHIDQKIFKSIQQGLRAAVADFSGTAHVLDMKDVYIAGKTGTAQTSGGQENHSWFVGYAKGAKKNIAFCVFLEHGGSSYRACLIAKDLLIRMKEKEIL